MKGIISKFNENLEATRESEQGDIVQTLLIIAVFVVAVIVIGGILMRVLRNKATAVETCINNSGAATQSGTPNAAC